MPVVYIARHGERIDFVDTRWVDSAERPFDPPLTARGVAQGAALGARLRSAPRPVTRIFASPFSRTVQTASAAAAALGVATVCVEPGLAEVLDEEWYECWRAKPGDPRAAACASKLLHPPAVLKATVSDLVDLAYEPLFDLATLAATRENAEQWAGMTARMEATTRQLAVRYPGEDLLLVTHGGPIEAVCPALDAAVVKGSKRITYTCLSAFDVGGGEPATFVCTLHACNSHTEGIPGDALKPAPSPAGDGHMSLIDRWNC